MSLDELVEAVVAAMRDRPEQWKRDGSVALVHRNGSVCVTKQGSLYDGKHWLARDHELLRTAFDRHPAVAAARAEATAAEQKRNKKLAESLN